MQLSGSKSSVNVIAFFLAIASSQSASGFEGPPPTLRALVKSSTLILVAEVSEVQIVESTATATLAVSQVVKGDRVGEKVIVEFIPGVTCPASPRYREGELVLAFLTRHGDHYQTVGTGHGAKVFTREQLAACVARIRELIAIERVLDPTRKRGALREWLVRCSEEPATRSDALQYMNPESHAILRGNEIAEHVAQPCQVGIRELTGGQRSRLFSVLTRLVAQGEEANHQRSLCRILAAASNDPRLVEAFRDFDEIKVEASAGGKFAQQRFARLNSKVVERFLGEYASVVMNEAIEGLFRATGQDSAIVE